MRGNARCVHCPVLGVAPELSSSAVVPGTRWCPDSGSTTRCAPAGRPPGGGSLPGGQCPAASEPRPGLGCCASAEMVGLRSRLRMNPPVGLDECLMLVGGDASDPLAWSDPGLLQDRAGCGRSITGLGGPQLANFRTRDDGIGGGRAQRRGEGGVAGGDVVEQVQAGRSARSWSADPRLSAGSRGPRRGPEWGSAWAGDVLSIEGDGDRGRATRR